MTARQARQAQRPKQAQPAPIARRGTEQYLDVALLVARILVGVVFLVAGLAKVGETSAFASAIRAFNLMPDPLVVPFAFFSPWLEALVGVYLLAGFMTRIGAAITGVLLIMFIVAIGDSLFTGNVGHPCGCFGSNPNPILTFMAGGNTVTWWDLIRDLILLALTAVVLVWGAGRLSVDAFLAGRRAEAS